MCTATQTIAVIEKHLDARPMDWQARRELADMLVDECRDDEARLQRWLAEHQRAPYKWWVAWYWLKEFLPEPPLPERAQVPSLVNNPVMIRPYASRMEAESVLMRLLNARGWHAPKNGEVMPI